MVEIKKVLDLVIKELESDEKNLKKLKDDSDIFCKELKGIISKEKIKAEVFIGGSLAKNTVIKKKRQDIDIFIRFDGKYNEEERKFYPC